MLEFMDNTSDRLILGIGIVVVHKEMLVEQVVYMDGFPAGKFGMAGNHSAEPVRIERFDADIPIPCRQCMELVREIGRFCSDHDTGGAVVKTAVHVFIADLIDMQVDIPVLAGPDLHEMAGQGIGSGRKDTQVDDLTLLAVIRTEIVELVVPGKNLLYQADRLFAVRSKESSFIGPAEDLDVQFGLNGVDNGA